MQIEKYPESGDHFGDAMVFRLNRKIRSSRRNRAAEVDFPNVHFEYTPKPVLLVSPGQECWILLMILFPLELMIMVV